jgi:hypothetical protein
MADTPSYPILSEERTKNNIFSNKITVIGQKLKFCLLPTFPLANNGENGAYILKQKIIHSTASKNYE